MRHGLAIAFCQKTNTRRDYPKRAKMYREILLTILIPLFLILVSLVAATVIMKLKRWRKRRMMERGITDLVLRIRSRKM
jgi:CHASE1-domain containing sensor protein